MKVFIHFLLLFFFFQTAFANVTLIPYGSSWKYLDNGTDQGTAWTGTSFNDASWASGNGQLGYGDGDETTLVGYGGNASAKYITTYFRKNITIGSTATYLDYTLNVKRDDGVVVYIDGTEVFRSNLAAGAITYTTLAVNAADDGNTAQSITLTLAQLPTGNHTIAVEMHQTNTTSSDLSFDLELVANESTVVSFGGSWRYLDNGTNQGTTWSATTFNDAAWASGNGELGYGDGDETTVIGYGGNVTNKYITTYFRKNISIGSTALFSNFTMNMVVDDGIVVYIDGAEVYRNNMPAGAISYLTLASSAYENNALTTNLTLAQLPTGNHTIAVEVHQTAVTSSDVSFNLELKANIANAVNITRGPYLNMATQNSVHIRWRTSSASNSIVNYGTIDGILSSSVTDATLTTEHDVMITGLLPDTKYYYSVGNSSPAAQTLNAGSDYYFYTLPVKGTERVARIWAMGDCGNNSSNQRNVRNSYMSYMGSNHTDVLLLLGDNAYNAGTDAEYTNNFYPIYQDSLLRNVILWPAPGNHDYANNGTRQNDHVIPYYDMFTLPTAGESGGIASGTEAFYSFDFANIHFLSLDSYGKESNTYRIWDTLGPQAVWVKNDLAANTQKWTIAYWHHPPYTLGSHSSESEADLIAIRQNFIRILERMGVDLILCGHSHVYERSYLLNGHYGNTASFSLATKAVSSSTAKYDNSSNSCPYVKKSPLSLGTVYVVAGSAGQLGGQQVGWPLSEMTYSNNTEGGGLALTVSGNRLDAEWVCNDGIVRDRFTMMKDVNKKEAYSIYEGDSIDLSSSWKGNYNWSGGYTTQQVRVSPDGLDVDTLTVTDNYNCLRDSFIVTKVLKLPVELVGFSADLYLSNQVLLQWHTASEYNNAYFTVEWSADAIHFSAQGNVPASGTTLKDSHYRFLHVTPKTGINYYRLKQTNTDSLFSYSSIKQVEVPSINNTGTKINFLYAFPNPSETGEFEIDYYAQKDKSSAIYVYNMMGKLIFKDELKILNGITHYHLNIADFPDGVYVVSVENENIRIQK